MITLCFLFMLVELHLSDWSDSLITMDVRPFTYSQISNPDDIITLKGAEYSFTNNSDEPYLTWIDFGLSDKTQVSLSESVRNYFFKQKGDFSLYSLYVDNVTGFYPQNEPVIGFSFLKRIKPGEVFRYIVLGDVSNDAKLKNSIRVEKESCVMYYLKYKEYEVFLYNKPYIVILNPKLTASPPRLLLEDKQ